MTHPRNVVLVHGGFVDGSGWQGVYNLLRADGFNVSVVQNPTPSLEGDVAFTRRVLDKQDSPTILVGHSNGGAVITEAGNHDKVTGLVYIAAFAPDHGESVGSLIAGFPADGAAADLAAAGRLPAPRPRPVRPVLRRRRLTRAHHLHGRRPGAVELRRPRRSDRSRRLAEQAELVPRLNRRPHDPPRPRSALWRSGSARPSPRHPAATRSTSRSPRPSSI
jgi:pimeloyl-ACP methyl ester carboxylesterase